MSERLRLSWLFGAVFYIRKRPWLLAAGALAFFVGYAAIVTFPYARNPANTTIAPLGGDVDSSIAFYQGLVKGHLSPFWATNFPWVAYPTGPINNIGVDRVSFFSVTGLWLGTRLLGAIAAHSLSSFLGLVLTAFVTFWLVRWITRSALAGLIAGFIFAFSPAGVGLAGSNMVYVHMWVLLLPLAAFWKYAVEKFSVKWLAIAAVSVVLGVFWTPYFMLHTMVVAFACLAVATYFVGRRDGWKPTLYGAALTAVWWAVLLYAYRYIGLHSPSSYVPVRTVEQIYQQSANPLMFALPGMYSWGIHDGNTLLVHLVPRANGLNLYLGLSTLILAAIGAFYFWKDRKHQKTKTLESRARIAAVMAGWAALACLAFSLPPTYHFGRLKIPTPNDLVAHAVPALRAGQRFEMPLLGCLAVLAGIGAWQLLRRFSLGPRLMVAAGLLVVIGFDLWALPPNWSTTIPVRQSLVSISKQPQAPLAWYEGNSMVIPIPQLPCVMQHEFNQPLVNDCGLGRSPDLVRLLRLPVCTQVQGLAAIGTQYVVLTNDNKDRQVRQCLVSGGLAKAALTQDSSYQVWKLKTLPAAQRQTIKSEFGLK